MLRIAIYARVSTSDKGQDPENQVRELRLIVGYKAVEGWAPAGEYVDHVSGKNANRAEFQRLFRDANERKFDMVLFWSLDRFTREGVLETLQHLQRLTRQDQTEPGSQESLPEQPSLSGHRQDFRRVPWLCSSITSSR